METDLLSVFSDPARIESLSVAARVWAGLITTVLGMGITFVVLAILQFVTGLFEKISGSGESKPILLSLIHLLQRHAGIEESKLPVPESKSAPAAKTAEEPVAQTNDELIPVIAASLAMMLQTPASNLLIRDIRRVDDRSSTWGRAGLAEQMQTRF
jgi:Na+-transporting methylmalonyl-CoA/oxaloacetate decarboxylase gamma subunit